MRTPRPPLLLEQCRAHLNAIYAPHLRQLPADAVIDCSYEPYSEPGKKGHGFTGSFAPIAKLTDMIVANHQRGDVYLGCGIQSMTKLHALGAKRGAGAALIGLPELWIDLDVHDDSRPEIRHKAANTANYPHPTLAEAYELIATIGITPTVVTRTSGGLHVHYSLTELLDLSVDSHKELFTMWRDAVVHAANAVHGRHIDSGVLSDRNRVLRPAGTISWKYSTPYLIQLESCDRTARLSHTGVREACDRILALEATFTAHLSAGGVAARTKPSQTAVRFDSDRALEAFSDRVSASDVLARTNQFNLVSGRSVWASSRTGILPAPRSPVAASTSTPPGSSPASERPQQPSGSE